MFGLWKAYEVQHVSRLFNYRSGKGWIQEAETCKLTINTCNLMQLKLLDLVRELL
jgi:hypothetical protein